MLPPRRRAGPRSTSMARAPDIRVRVLERHRWSTVPNPNAIAASSDGPRRSSSSRQNTSCTSRRYQNLAGRDPRQRCPKRQQKRQPRDWVERRVLLRGEQRATRGGIGFHSGRVPLRRSARVRNKSGMNPVTGSVSKKFDTCVPCDSAEKGGVWKMLSPDRTNTFPPTSEADSVMNTERNQHGCRSCAPARLQSQRHRHARRDRSIHCFEVGGVAGKRAHANDRPPGFKTASRHAAALAVPKTGARLT